MKFRDMNVPPKPAVLIVNENNDGHQSCTYGSLRVFQKIVRVNPFSENKFLIDV